MIDVDLRNVLLNTATIVFAVLLCFSGFEAVLYTGVVDTESQYPYYEACEGKTTWQFHPNYGWTLRPDATYLRQQNSLQEKNLYQINSNGFRDTYDRGNDSNVVVLGDSQTAGWIVNDNRTYPYLLDRETPDTAVHNYGVPGYGTEQELAVYSSVSDSTDHELVVLGYYAGNDMRDNVDSNPRRPKFVLENGELSRQQGPINKTRDTNETRSVFSISGFKNFLLENTRTFSYLKPRLAALLSYAGLRTKQPPKGDELNRQLRLTEALVRNVSEQARAEDADVLIVFIPERTEVNPQNPTHFSAEQGQPYWDSQRQMLRSLSQSNSNIHFLDLKPHFEEQRNAGNRIYGKRNGHIDEYGHQVTARVIYRWLVAEGYVAPQDSTPFQTRQPSRDASCP